MKKPPCYNRKAYNYIRIVQDGWQVITLRDEQTGEIVTTRVPVVKQINDPMSKECMQHTAHGAATIYGWDCSGCRWLKTARR